MERNRDSCPGIAVVQTSGQYYRGACKFKIESHRQKPPNQSSGLVVDAKAHLPAAPASTVSLDLLDGSLAALFLFITSPSSTNSRCPLTSSPPSPPSSVPIPILLSVFLPPNTILTFLPPSDRYAFHTISGPTAIPRPMPSTSFPLPYSTAPVAASATPVTAIGGTTIASSPVETARTTFAPLLRDLGLCCGGGKGECECEGCEEEAVDSAEEREEEDGAEEEKEEEEVVVVDEAEEALLCSLLEGR